MILLRGKEEALHAVGVISLGQLIELNRQLVLDTAKISLDFNLALADSIILATARANNATLWTQDERFKGLEESSLLKRNKK